jgi:hypothetical protein
MNPAPDRRTLKESMRTVREADDFGYALRNFLDRFRRDPAIQLLKDEPDSLTNMFNDEGLADAYLASAAALLCQEQGFSCPEWVDQPDRVFKRPWFAAKTPNLKAILLQESPAAFRVRNLFVSANALSRA